MTEGLTDIRSLFEPELAERLAPLGEPAYRASQIFSWLHEKRADSFDEMTNLPKTLRNELKKRFRIPSCEKVLMQESALDGTRKYLFRLEDGHMIESVLMRYRYGNSVCVSTQVGCRMGCRFCASTLGGRIRDLAPSEILDQIYRIGKDTGERVSHVVLMGSGEPFDNYDAVVRFLKLVSDPKGQNLSLRNITVSTCGLTEGILKFAKEGLPVTLALSLHAADDETRKKIMPVANRYSLSEVLKACDAYFSETGRRVSYEYSVVKGVNDTKEEAEKLAGLLKGRNAHVNLIPVNPVRENGYERPDPESVAAFQKVLVSHGIQATVRREMGSDIDGACGQLRAHFLNREEGGAVSS